MIDDMDNGSHHRLDFRIPEREKKILEQYCQVTQRTKTDVLREFLRTLEDKLTVVSDTSKSA